MSSSEEEKEEIPMPSYRIRFTDMDRVCQEKAIRSKYKKTNFIKVCDSLQEKYKVDKELSTAIKEAFDKDEHLKDPTAGWHVIAGKSFASAITYNTKNMIFFDLVGRWNKTFLIFKTN